MALTKYGGTGIFLLSHMTGYLLDERVVQKYNTYIYYFCTGAPCDIQVWYGISGRVKIFQFTDEVRVCL